MIDRIYVSEATLRTIERFGQNNLTNVAGRADAHLCVEFVRARGETVPKWVFDGLVNTLQPAWDYIQTHQDQFGALAGDDKNAILVDFFLRAASANNIGEQLDAELEARLADGDRIIEELASVIRAPRTDVAGAVMMPPVKGISIDGGYVIVTPAGGRDNAPAIKAAILALAGANPSADAAAAPADERMAFETWYERTYPLSAEALRTGACDESIEESRDELALGFGAGWKACAAASQPSATRNDHICHDGEDCHACDAERAAVAGQEAVAVGEHFMGAGARKQFDELMGENASLREALLVQVLEPVAIYQTCHFKNMWRDVDRAEYERTICLRRNLGRIVYTAPPAQVATRQGLTDAHIIETAEIIGISDVVTDDRLVKFVRALLEGAKHE